MSTLGGAALADDRQLRDLLVPKHGMASGMVLNVFGHSSGGSGSISNIWGTVTGASATPSNRLVVNFSSMARDLETSQQGGKGWLQTSQPGQTLGFGMALQQRHRNRGSQAGFWDVIGPGENRLARISQRWGRTRGLSTENSLAKATARDAGLVDQGLSLAPAVREFCARQGILSYVPVAVDLVRRVFPSMQKLQLRAIQDPETDNAWLLIEITVTAEIDDFLRQYDRYTDEWLASVSWPESTKIRLAYNLI